MNNNWDNQREINKLLNERIELNVEQICRLMKAVTDLSELVETMAEEIDILNLKLSKHGIES